MKKTYKSPVTIIVCVEQQLMQTASLGKDSTTKISDNDAVLGRRDRGSFWDDEEE